MNKELLKYYARLELARRDFFYYCHLMAGDFYTADRAFLVNMCREMQDFVEKDDYKVLIINLPPRAGKSRSAQKLVEWVLGNDRTQKIMTGSYNTTLSTMFSKNVRNTIQETKADQSRIVYSDIFPDVRIKSGDGAMNLWSLEGGYNNYLATAPGGSATGFGASLIIIDDLIKNDYEAHNEAVKEKQYSWFTDTMLSRLEEGGKIMIVMTRWATDDLAGRALDHFGKLGVKIKHICYKAVQDDGSLLCESILSHESIALKKATIGLDIFNANYQQEPIDIKGRLYSGFKTYTEIPKDESGQPLFKYILNYTDTADTGSDFLCSICYGVYEESLYILDILYTKDAMEITEPKTAEMLTKNNVGCAIIESNNGGRSFARNVERECRERFKNNHTVIKWFHQSQNKAARILSNSASVQNNIIFPVNWKDRFPEFAEDIMKYQKEGKNAHDDACFVAGTMVATLFGDKPIEKVKKGDLVITPYGLRKVLAAGCTGEKETITRFGIEATPNHKFFSKEKGFVRFDELTGVDENGKISLKELIKWTFKKQLYLMESNMNCLDRESIILVSQIQMKDEKEQKIFMLPYGNTTTGKKFLKAFKFIIKTLIRTTMILAIWSVYQLSNMLKFTQSATNKMLNMLKHGKRILTKQERKPTNGTQAKKAENGILNMAKKSTKEDSPKSTNVLNAETSLKQFNRGRNSVVMGAAKSGDEKTNRMNTRQSVNIAEKSLSEKSQNLPQKEAECVLQVAGAEFDKEREKKKVYNISVEGNHVFYARGFLVSNCDALTGVYENTKPKGETKLNRKITGGL